MIIIRLVEKDDIPVVRALFIQINRMIAPSDQKHQFEDYINHSLKTEIDRLDDYYAGKDCGFWVAFSDDTLVGMFGLEKQDSTAFELRRMYVDPSCRRQGIAKKLLSYAEKKSRDLGGAKLILSTSELQSEALSLYRWAGYKEDRIEIAEQASNKTVGGGIRRFHFVKEL